MPSEFIIEFTEDNKRKREQAQFGNFDGDVEAAQREAERIWGGALPGRTDIKVVSVVGAGDVRRVGAPATPQEARAGRGDAERIAKGVTEGGK